MNSTVTPSSDTTQRLQSAVHRLNAWLYDSEHAEGWRRALMLNVLETQAARGEQADIGTLSVVHCRFSQATPGLNHPTFVDVRVALQHQILHLSASRIGDLYAAVTMARGQYQRISIGEMIAQRDLARSELKDLKQYYRHTVSSRERANLFYDLQLDQAIEHLGELKFELAPEVSVGKMDSMIRFVEGQQDEVEKAIDALPATPDPDDGELDPADKPADQEIEPALEITPNVFGPEPDEDERTPGELKKEYDKLQLQIDKLKDQRSEIAESDKTRQSERGKTFGDLRRFELRFVDVSSDRGDPYFVSALAAYERFVRTYFYGTSDNLQEDFLKRMEELETNLLKLDGPEAREAAGNLGDDLRWMENANQISHLVSAIRSRYSNPNVYVSISSNLINQVSSQPVNQSRYVRQTMQGRLVRGIARTNGQVNVELMHDPNQVHANIRLLGTVNSQTYIEQGRIRVYAGANGQLEGRRSIYANVGGLYAGKPYAAANMQTSLLGTSSRLRIVNRIVAKKFAESKAETESRTSRTTEEQLLESFRERTNEPIRKGQEALEKAQDKRVANSNRIPELYARSFTSEIMAVGKKSSISTLGAQNLPANTGVYSDVAVRLHDSMLSNFLDPAFSGKTFTDKELAEELGEIFGQAPKALATEPGEEGDQDESFSITFANVRPIQFEFEDNGFRVVVSGRRFSQGDKRINEGMKIILKFRIKRIDGKLKFVRDGKAQLDYLDDDYPAAAVAFKSFLDGKLNPEEGGDQLSVDLPENLLPIDTVEALKDIDIAKRLRLVQCRSESGWLYLGWNYQPEHYYPAWQYDLPAILTETTIYQMEPIYLYDSNPGTLQLNPEN